MQKGKLLTVEVNPTQGKLFLQMGDIDVVLGDLLLYFSHVPLMSQFGTLSKVIDQGTHNTTRSGCNPECLTHLLLCHQPFHNRPKPTYYRLSDEEILLVTDGAELLRDLIDAERGIFAPLVKDSQAGLLLVLLKRYVHLLLDL